MASTSDVRARINEQQDREIEMDVLASRCAGGADLRQQWTAHHAAWDAWRLEALAKLETVDRIRMGGMVGGMIGDQLASQATDSTVAEVEGGLQAQQGSYEKLRLAFDAAGCDTADTGLSKTSDFYRSVGKYVVGGVAIVAVGGILWGALKVAQRTGYVPSSPSRRRR
jgi:hypothetical protein